MRFLNQEYVPFDLIETPDDLGVVVGEGLAPAVIDGGQEAISKAQVVEQSEPRHGRDVGLVVSVEPLEFGDACILDVHDLDFEAGQRFG